MGSPVTWFYNKLKDLNELIWHTPLSELTRRKIFLVK